MVHVGFSNVLKVQLYDQFGDPYYLINSNTESLTVTINDIATSGFFSVDEGYPIFFSILERGEIYEGTMDIHVVCHDSFSETDVETSQVLTVDRYYALRYGPLWTLLHVVLAIHYHLFLFQETCIH